MSTMTVVGTIEQTEIKQLVYEISETRCQVVTLWFGKKTRYSNKATWNRTLLASGPAGDKFVAKQWQQELDMHNHRVAFKAANR